MPLSIYAGDISRRPLTMPLSIYAGDISRRPLNLGCRKVESAAEPPSKFLRNLRFFCEKILLRLRLATFQSLF